MLKHFLSLIISHKVGFSPLSNLLFSRKNFHFPKFYLFIFSTTCQRGTFSLLVTSREPFQIYKFFNVCLLSDRSLISRRKFPIRAVKNCCGKNYLQQLFFGKIGVYSDFGYLRIDQQVLTSDQIRSQPLICAYQPIKNTSKFWVGQLC